MQFAQIDDYLAVSRITGPTHNLLQVRLSETPGTDITCDCLPSHGDCIHEPLDPKAIVAAVKEGLIEANQALGSAYSVSHIRYIQNDTKPEAVYRFLMLSIIRHLHLGGAFAASRNNA